MSSISICLPIARNDHDTPSSELRDVLVMITAATKDCFRKQLIYKMSIFTFVCLIFDQRSKKRKDAQQDYLKQETVPS